jgi:4-diphosphocytidyl-2-C-methyl-D-erythritol kinase
LTLTEAAPAKVNLYLHVTGRRDDGYHLLDSLVVFAGAADALRAAPHDGLSLEVAGPFAAGLSADSGNLVLRAMRALAEATGQSAGARLTLEKRLPVASGIGGGSADAAATLRLLCRLWGIAPPSAALRQIALGLGADVPVCLRSVPCRMGGIGERLDDRPALPRAGLALVNPGVAVPTAGVFRARTGGFSAPASLAPSWPDAAALAADLRRTGNDLEPAARRLQPVISTVLDALAAQPGCLLARMSGSGATCFGLFPNEGAAMQAASALRRPGWWSWGGPLREP